MNSSATLIRDRPAPRDGERRQDDQHDQQHDLEPEAAEARAALGVERLALVLDRSNRGGLVGGGHESRGYRPTPGRGRRAGPMTQPIQRRHSPGNGLSMARRSMLVMP